MISSTLLYWNCVWSSILYFDVDQVKMIDDAINKQTNYYAINNNNNNHYAINKQAN